MKKRKKVAIGIAVGIAVAFKVGLHIWAVKHVPYTYRTSGLKNLTDYILLGSIPMTKRRVKTMRLIDAEALINELNNSRYPGAPYVDAGISIAIGKVCDAPTVEPERKRGKWIDEETNYRCSECHRGCWVNSDYCPWCGADMRGGQDEQENNIS